MNFPLRKSFGYNEILAVKKVIKYYIKKKQDPPYRGIFEKKFTDAFSKFMGGGNTVAVSTGTAAAFVAIQALMLKKGTKILVSPFVDAGPVNAILMLGYIPVFIDTDRDSYNINLVELKKKITPQTSAVFLVHSAGDPVKDTLKIANFLKKKKIKLIEDCSQCTGGLLYKKKKVGSIGDVSVFSTMYRKILTTGGSGGLIFSKSNKLYRMILACSDRGKPLWRKNYDFRDPGMHLFPALNWNTDEFSCAQGLSSLQRLKKSIKKRQNFIKSLNFYFKKFNIQFFKIYRMSNYSSPFFLPIFLNNKILKFKKKILERLIRIGIPLNPKYKFLPTDWKWLGRYIKYKIYLPNSLRMRDMSFNLFVNENYNTKCAKFISYQISMLEKTYKKS